LFSDILIYLHTACLMIYNQ